MKEYVRCKAPAGAVYGLGLIEAAIYFISTATGFWMGVLGFLKALVLRWSSLTGQYFIHI